MLWRPLLLSLGSSLLLSFAACSGGEATSTTTSSSTSTGGAGGNGSGGSGGGADCTSAGITKAIGPDGGTLSYCGATLVFPPGALDKEITIGLAVEPSPPTPPFERAFAGPVFNISPADQTLLAPVDLTLPHTAPGARLDFGRYDQTEGAVVAIEVCSVTETTVQQFVGALGTYGVLRDVNDYPPGPSGLGGGTMDLDFLGSMSTWDVDAPGNYGIYTSRPDGGRNVTLYTIRDVAGGVESLRVDFSVQAGGMAGSLIQVQWVSTVTSAGYSYIEGLVGSGGSLTVMETTDKRLVGEIAATLHGGNPQDDQPLTVTFDVSAEKFAFPPELSCPGGGG